MSGAIRGQSKAPVCDIDCIFPFVMVAIIPQQLMAIIVRAGEGVLPNVWWSMMGIEPPMF
jgi:hypothetical protein